MTSLENAFSISDDEPFAMRMLTEQQKVRLAELLEQYMSAIETGLPPSIAALTESSPELREPLRSCVEGLENLNQMAGLGRVPRQEPVSTDASHCLGDFELHEELGRGGMGVVYRATQISLRRTVAIKLLPPASVVNSQKLTRFQHEAEAAASLQHPNIVPVFAVGCERGTHFYAMQYIDGDSLDATPPGGLGNPALWRETVTHAIAVAKGLHAAHKLGIVHRDIKPSNLILDREGKIWISDFGLARIQSDMSLTQSGDVIGTIRYMSPEQTRGESALVDGRADVYSLAATLYELLSGTPAHDGNDAPTVLRQIDDNSVVPLSSHRPSLPRDLTTVIAKAMSKRRDDRYETANAFAEDLSRVIAGAPTIARPATILDHAVRIAVAQRAVVASVALVCILALAGFTVGTTMLAAEKRVSDTNAAVARSNETIAREAIERLGTQATELLKDIPAANAVRHRLLLSTLDYYERLANQSRNTNLSSLERQLDLAQTHGKIGSLQSELGLASQSLVSLNRSQQILADLAAERPDDDSLQSQWSISQNNLADAFVRKGDFESAAKWFGKAIANQRDLFIPGDQETSRALAVTLNNFGQMLTQAEHTGQAETVFNRALELLEDKPVFADLQATIQSNAAGLLAKSDPSRACKLAKQTLGHQIKQLDENPSDARAATQVVVTLNTLATAQAALLEHDAAIDSLRQAVSISNQLRQRWPNQSSYRRDLGISLNRLGLSLSSIGETTQAQIAFRQATEHATVLVDQFEGDAEVHSMLGGILNNLGFLHQQLGQRSAAIQQYASATKHLKTAVDLAPQVPRYQFFLKKHQQNQSQLRGES